MASALAIATRCFCPPEIWRGFAWIYGAIPTLPRNSIACLRASSLLRCSTFTCPTTQLSSTDILLNRLKDWKTIPTFALYAVAFAPLPAIFSPLNRISPLFGVSSRLIHRRSVDFPDPELPIMLITSPRLTVKSISFSTSCFPKLLDRCLICNICSFIIQFPCPVLFPDIPCCVHQRGFSCPDSCMSLPSSPADLPVRVHNCLTHPFFSLPSAAGRRPAASW